MAVKYILGTRYHFNQRIELIKTYYGTHTYPSVLRIISTNYHVDKYYLTISRLALGLT